MMKNCLITSSNPTQQRAAGKATLNIPSIQSEGIVIGPELWAYVRHETIHTSRHTNTL